MIASRSNPGHGAGGEPPETVGFQPFVIFHPGYFRSITHGPISFSVYDNSYRLLKKISEARRAKIDERRRTVLVR